MVGLGGGSLADVLDPVLIRPDATVIPATWAANPDEIVRGLAGFRNIAAYVTVIAPPALTAQASLRLQWYWDQSPGQQFAALRRVVGALEVDELLLPVVAAGQAGRFLVPIANPGGAVALALQFRDEIAHGGTLGYRVSGAS